ncbi:MAG: hypothetical protein M0011_13440 [Elusimicrobia bacterium]|nr:hypothetical protein [Elusimicrobiota bacterium]
MDTLRALIAACALAAAGGPVFAAEPVQWKAQEHITEFKFLFETGKYKADSWNALSPDEQQNELRDSAEPAQQRLEAVQAYYEAAMRPWDTEQLRDYVQKISERDISTVRLWLGEEAGTELRAKVTAVREAMGKANSQDGLRQSDVDGLRQYLTPEAISALRSIKVMRGAQGQSSEFFKKSEVPKGAVNSTLSKVSGSLSSGVSGSLTKAFDGNAATGDASAVDMRGGRYQVPKNVMNGVSAEVSRPMGDFVAEKTAGVLNPGQPRGTTATTVKSAAPQQLGGGTKSTSWTSDAYGYTITTSDGRTQTFRDQRQAEAAIRALPNGSVSKIILYGHGAPGGQTVGSAYYEAGDTAALLKGKMTPGGVVQYTGCNTASIGDATLNPAVGLSMLTRRLLYFSVPYWQDRFSGVPADEARKQWEKTWNADLARDTSRQMGGTIVCGLRTFGLVPGRLPGVTRVMGNQEATTPGYVAGKKVCYQDGREVPEP